MKALPVKSFWFTAGLALIGASVNGIRGAVFCAGVGIALCAFAAAGESALGGDDDDW